MKANDHTWAIVLAAGDGSRLSGLTRFGRDTAVPKQFCSLDGDRSLLATTLARARSVVGKNRVVTIVAERHRPMWEREFVGLKRQSLIVQPSNKGTAAGVLLPLLTILERDPSARVAVFPSDHYVDDEPVLRSAVRQGLDLVRDREIILFGIAPDSPVSDYGWIMPVPGTARVRRIQEFVEKPNAELAASCLARGGLWNSFLLVARGQALIDLYTSRVPELLVAFGCLEHTTGAERTRRASELYEGLESRDFSRHLLQGGEADLRVYAVPHCGWTDLGTPQRVAECVRTRAIHAHDHAPPEMPVLAASLAEGAIA